MAPYIGRLESVGIAKESSRGVGVAAQYALPRTNFTFDDRANEALSTEVLGHISGNGPQSIVTQLFSEGNIDGEINANSFGLILLALFGSEVVTTVSGAQKHTFSLTNGNQHQTLTIHLDNPSISSTDRVYEGCVIDQLDIDINPEDIVSFSAGFKGKKGQDSSYAASYAADYKFVGRDLTFKIAADVASLAAASALSIKELKLSIKKNADFDFVLGTLEPENIPNKQIVIEGSFTLNHESITYRDYMLNGTYRAMSILLNNSRDAISTNTPQIYLEFPVVDFFEWERDRSPDDVVTQSINFRVLYDVANSRLISSAYIINNVSAY